MPPWLTGPIQFVSLVLAVVLSTITILEKLRGHKKATEEAARQQQPGARPLLHRFPGDPQRHPQDRIATLLVAAVFSLTVIDALVVIGSTGIHQTSLVFAILISLAITLLSIASWYYGAEQKTLLVLGLATFIVLVFARGGPFHPSYGQVIRHGDILLFFAPLFTVSVIISTLIVYSLGSLRRLSGARTVLLLSPVIVAALAQGVRFFHDVELDKRAPKPLTKESLQLLHQTERLTHSDETAFYQFASEAALSPYYDGQSLDAFYGQNSAAISAAEPTEILTDFQHLDRDTKLKYMIERMRWIHPVGSSSDLQAPIGLPGLTVQERLKSTASLRNVTLLSDRGGAIRAYFLKTYDYPSEVRAAFHSIAISGDKDPETIIYEVLGIDQPAPATSVPELFSVSGSLFSSDNFNTQMVLPGQDEFNLARLEYRDAAEGSFSESVETIAPLFGKFNSLDDYSRLAFLDYVMSSPDPGKVIAALSRLAGVDFGPAFSSKDPNPMDAIAAAVKADSLNANDQGRPSNSDAYRGSTAAKTVGVQKTQVHAPDESQTSAAATVDLPHLIIQRTSDSRQDRDELVALMLRRDSVTSGKWLFTSKALQFSRDLSSTFGSEELRKALEALSEPTVFTLSNAIGSDSRFDRIRPLFQDFISLNPGARDDLLHRVAIGIYRSDGPNSLGPIRQMIADADSIAWPLGWFCSFAMFLPLFLGGTYLAHAGANCLHARDALQGSIREEQELPVQLEVGRELVTMVGREDEMARLGRLTTKNRSTIALTGRRGCGKSRILREVFRQEMLRGSLAVWIDSPTKYAEGDFVASLLERLGASVGQFQNSLASHRIPYALWSARRS
jgi:hypothetical protein